MILYRPVGLQELALIYDSDMKSFPARLPQQPIFYPVLQIEYARQTAADWNVKNGGFAGYVTQFKVEDEYIRKFEEHTVGEAHYQELWIPAEEVDEFNKHITGHIKVVEAHFGDAFEGFIPDTFGFQGKNAVAQFTLLANSFLYRRMDFYLEIKRNHKAVFLNYPFWQKYEFKNPGLKEKVLQAIKEGWLTSFPKIPLPVPPPVQEAGPRMEQKPSAALEDTIEGEVLAEEPAYSYPPAKPLHEAPPPVKQIPARVQRSDDRVPEDIQPVEQTAARTPVVPLQKETGPARQTVSHFSQGVKLGLDGEYHEAVSELSRAIEADPAQAAAHTSLGVAFHRLGEDDRALACYDTAIKTDPRYAEAHYFRANILHSRGNVREAIAGYTTALGLEPELIEAHEGPAPEDRLTDYSSVAASIHRIAKPARRILDLNKSIETNPRQADLFKERAAEYSRLGNYEGAIADYDSTLKLQPDDAGALHLRGVAYEQLGNGERARDDYRRASAIDPQLPDLYFQRGVTFGSTGNYRQSIDSLTDGIRLAPRNPHGYFNRGVSYFQLGELENAIADFSRVVQLSPDDEDAYYWRGISNEEAGRQGEAIADYRRFLELSQDANARAEIEQRLGQRPDDRSSLPEDQGRIDQLPPEKQDGRPDLYELIAALGERALHSTWFGSGVDCYGEKAEELSALVQQEKPIEGGDFVAITSGIQQTLEGDFYALDPGATVHWIFIRAWDGTGFYIEINDPRIRRQLKSQFQGIEEVDQAAPPYEALFLHI